MGGLGDASVGNASGSTHDANDTVDEAFESE
jgi:hypothetical protein